MFSNYKIVIVYTNKSDLFKKVISKKIKHKKDVARWKTRVVYINQP